MEAEEWDGELSEKGENERNRRKQNKCLADKWIKLQMD